MFILTGMTWTSLIKTKDLLGGKMLYTNAANPVRPQRQLNNLAMS